MSADKHRNLALKIAYLRLASGDFGLPLNVKHARKLTPLLQSMADDKLVVLRRVGGRLGGKSVTTAYATDAGRTALEGALKRFGPDFGPVSGLERIEPVCEPKDVRRRKANPVALHVKAARRAAVVARGRAWIAGLTNQAVQTPVIEDIAA
jgi:hypothetical protein